MPALFLYRLRRFAVWLVLDLLVACCVLGVAAWADTSTKLNQPSTSGCYCHCAMAKASAGCAKMCDLPKFATRRWAVTCAKPHASLPLESPNSQPHLPHPPRAERASN
jgi:hypothetical protein